jgi:hypothetical protein
METAMVSPAQVQQLYITTMVRVMAWGLAVVLQVMGR